MDKQTHYKSTLGRARASPSKLGLHQRLDSPGLPNAYKTWPGSARYQPGSSGRSVSSRQMSSSASILSLEWIRKSSSGEQMEGRRRCSGYASSVPEKSMFTQTHYERTLGRARGSPSKQGLHRRLDSPGLPNAYKTWSESARY